MRNKEFEIPRNKRKKEKEEHKKRRKKEKKNSRFKDTNICSAAS